MASHSVKLSTKTWEPVGHLQGSLGPSPKPQKRPETSKNLGTRWPFTGLSKTPKKSEKSLPGPPAPGPPESLEKVSKKSRESVWKKSRKGPEKTFSRLFPDSRGPRGRRPLETFFRHFRGFGLGRLERPL